MATGLKIDPKATKTGTAPDAGRVLYLYAISRKTTSAPPRVVAEGIDGVAQVEAFHCDGYICWTSRVNREEFADHLAENMENLEWLASAGLRHQRVVSTIAEKLVALPARFGTVFLTESSMAQHVRQRSAGFEESFELVADADEWGIKVFRVEKAKARTPQPAPSSGVEYLKRKAESRQVSGRTEVDDEVQTLVDRLSSLAVGSSPGGKASVGQLDLLWHGSFLIRRKDRQKVEALLKEFATKWHGTRRIDWSGPWPPYSFVGHDAH